MKSLRARQSKRYTILALASFAVMLGILSIFVIWQAPTKDVVSREDEREAHARWIGLPSVHSASLSQWGNMCIHVMTGTRTSTYVIANPNGLGPIADYHVVNFDQKVLSRSATSARVQIVSRAYFDTSAPFPVNASTLPPDIRPYLQPNEWQQSNNSAIKALAQALVSDAQTQVQAVNSILDWVIANITYNWTFSLPNDAVSVFQNRSGVCAGFSNLAVALLRAAGIPARDRYVCAFRCGYVVGPEGGGHAVIETYYPDAGWVPSEPQGEENLINTCVLFGGFHQCGATGTTISRDSVGGREMLYTLASSHPNDICIGVVSASVLSWDRDPLHVSPSKLELVLSPDETSVSTMIEVDNTEACDPTWEVESDVPWISLSPSEGIFKAPVTVTINTTLLEWGLNSGTITADERKAVPIHVWLFEEIHRTRLPIIVCDAGL